MNLQIDCTWNKNSESGKLLVTFDNTPSSFFSLDPKAIDRIKSLEKSCLLDGPVGLKELEEIQKDNPNSLYAFLICFQALRSFEFFDEAFDLFKKMHKKFPNEVIVKSLQGYYFLEDKNLKGFFELFKGSEVLIPAFPERKSFHYQEALLFHYVWDLYHTMQKDVFQAEKHKKMMDLLLNASEELFKHSNQAPIRTQEGENSVV